MFFYILCPQNCDFLIKILRDNQEIIKKIQKSYIFVAGFVKSLYICKRNINLDYYYEQVQHYPTKRE